MCSTLRIPSTSVKACALSCSWTPKVCKIMAKNKFKTPMMLLFYILWGSGLGLSLL